jgi:hypothetical protein
LNEKRVEIKAIEFDWIFHSKEASQFLKILSETNNLNLFSLKIIKNIVLFFWKYFQKMIIIKVFLPFALYFLLVIINSTYFYEKRVENNDSGWKQLNNTCDIMIIVIALYFLYIEVR